MKKSFILLLAAMLLVFSVSLAETAVIDISSEGYDCMYYQCALPDGRIILAGWKGTPGNWEDSRARILCLNPDMSVSWEYLDPAEGSCGYTRAAVLDNGLIGAVFENAPGQALAERKLKFFAPDGTPAGEAIDLTIPGTLVDGAAASCLWLTGYNDTRFVDWEGNTLFCFEDGQNPVSGCDRMIGTEDGPVFAGSASGDVALLIKLDLRGEVVWRTEIPASGLPGVEGANLTDCIRTEDGGCLAQLVEYGPEISAYRSLVRFGADGSILWRSSEAFDRFPDTWLNALGIRNGRIVAELLGSGDDYGMNAVSSYLWMGGDGRLLAVTHYDAKDLALPRPETNGSAEVSSIALISTGDGLWSLSMAERLAGGPAESLDTADCFLVRVPEP